MITLYDLEVCLMCIGIVWLCSDILYHRFLRQLERRRQRNREFVRQQRQYRKESLRQLELMEQRHKEVIKRLNKDTYLT